MDMLNRHSIQRTLRLAGVLLVLLGLAACKDGGPTALAPGDPIDDPITDPVVVEGVNLTALFAAPAAAEIDAVTADWATRDVTPRNVEVLTADTLRVNGLVLDLRVVAHRVAGVRHVGAVLTPRNAAPGSLPVLVYTHGGDNGEDLDETLPLITTVLGDLAGAFVFVVPSFRAETLTVKNRTYESEGPPSPWNYDVDDALALLNLAIDTTPEADPSRIGVLGFSRGGGVGLLMAARDPRIDRVVEFFGPTDFFGPDIQTIAGEALTGELRNLPGLAYLDDRYLQPLKAGTTTVPAVRAELVRRSAVLFAARLPDVQVHHGTADDVVSVEQAESLIEAMEALSRTPPSFEPYLYEGGGHHPLQLAGSLNRSLLFLTRLTEAEPS